MEGCFSKNYHNTQFSLKGFFWGGIDWRRYLAEWKEYDFRIGHSITIRVPSDKTKRNGFLKQSNKLVAGSVKLHMEEVATSNLLF